MFMFNMSFGKAMILQIDCPLVMVVSFHSFVCVDCLVMSNNMMQEVHFDASPLCRNSAFFCIHSSLCLINFNRCNIMLFIHSM